MENLEKMINDIDVESLEKTINILTGLKVFMKIEKKELEKSIEEQIFELIKDDIQFYFVIPLNFNAFSDYIYKMRDKIKYSNYSRYCFFLAIMKGVHHLIEGKNKRTKEYGVLIFDYDNDTRNCSYLNMKKLKLFPYFFYFSGWPNREKAYNILSNFFGINILDWWYK